ncbi:MAG TPA: DUF3000 family protein [Streptosporangiaceae bacterium]
MRPADRPVRQHPAPRDPARRDNDGAAAQFGAVMAEFEAGRDSQRELRADFTFEDVPAPKRLAPFSAAMAATVRRDDADIAWGRLVLLYDPAGQDGWPGNHRLISYLRAEMEPEIAADPMLCQVGWSWLIEALDARTPGYGAPSGTVTRVTTEGFGGKEDEAPVHGFELRASWSPTSATHSPGRAARARPAAPVGEAVLDIAAHVTAWCDSLAAAAGLPPLALGTHALSVPGAGQSPRRRR